VLLALDNTWPSDQKQIAGTNVDAIDLEGNWQEKILTAEDALSAEKTNFLGSDASFADILFFDPRRSA
jgi:hypothetical protein